MARTGASDAAHDAALDRLERQNLQLQRAVQELSLLNDLAGRIGALRDVDEVMQAILRQSLSVIEADQGVITIVHEGDEKETLRTLVRTAAGAKGAPALRPDESLFGWMHHHQAPLRVDAPQRDPRFRGVDWPEGVHSALCAPLSVRGRLTGIIILYNKRGAAAFGEDDQRLLSIIASQSAQVIENARLFEEEKTLLRMQEELRLAREIQTSLLPEAAPDVAGYDLAGVSIPAQEVGGDFFDFIPLDDARLAFCVADVVGKGLPASLLMATSQATLRGQTDAETSPAGTLARANDMLCRSIRRGRFVTAFHGLLDYAQHRIVYANAGHNRPLLRSRDGRTRYLPEAGLVLGVRPGWAYAQDEVTMEEGDVLVVYSDGLTEAMNVEREQFGEERLEAVLHDVHAHPAERIIDALLDAAREHAGGTARSDDITIIVVRRLRDGA